MFHLHALCYRLNHKMVEVLSQFPNWVRDLQIEDGKLNQKFCICIMMVLQPCKCSTYHDYRIDQTYRSFLVSCRIHWWGGHVNEIPPRSTRMNHISDSTRVTFDNSWVVMGCLAPLLSVDCCKTYSKAGLKPRSCTDPSNPERWPAAGPEIFGGKIQRSVPANFKTPKSIDGTLYCMVDFKSGPCNCFWRNLPQHSWGLLDRTGQPGLPRMSIDREFGK